MRNCYIIFIIILTNLVLFLDYYMKETVSYKILAIIKKAQNLRRLVKEFNIKISKEYPTFYSTYHCYSAKNNDFMIGSLLHALGCPISFHVSAGLAGANYIFNPNFRRSVSLFITNYTHLNPKKLNFGPLKSLPAVGDKINFNLVGLGTTAIVFLNNTLFDKKEGDELSCGIIHSPKQGLSQKAIRIPPIFPAEFEMSIDPMPFLLKKDYKINKDLLKISDTIYIDRFRSDSEDSIPCTCKFCCRSRDF